MPLKYNYLSFRHNNFTAMAHMGKKLREAIEKESIIKTHLCRDVWGKGANTRTLYNWFEVPVIPWDNLKKILDKYPVLNKYFADKVAEYATVSDVNEKYGNDWQAIAEEWKQKYYLTLGQLTECKQQLTKV